MYKKSGERTLFPHSTLIYLSPLRHFSYVMVKKRTVLGNKLKTDTKCSVRRKNSKKFSFCDVLFYVLSSTETIM